MRNRYNQEPHLTHDTNGKVTNSQLDTTNERQEVSPFPAGDHKAQINSNYITTQMIIIIFPFKHMFLVRKIKVLGRLFLYTPKTHVF